MLTFQQIISNLQNYWSKQGCLVMQSYDMEMGAATFNPFTSLKALGNTPWNAVFTQPCRRPSDGRYGENPNRLQHYYQLQVILKFIVLQVMVTLLLLKQVFQQEVLVDLVM